MSKAICPGSYDPFTTGHLDIVTRAASVFEEVTVLILVHPSKRPCFTKEQRLEFIKKSIAHLENVTVDFYEGLLVDYCIKNGATTIVRGLRALADFEYEFQMALVNKKLAPGVETFFMTTDTQNMFISSSIVRQVAALGRSIKGFVPDAIQQDVEKLMGDKDGH